MAISGLQIINIGLQNESLGSDSLYTAFNKTKTNFATLFANASPYNTFTGNAGISITSNSTSGVVDITNTGVRYLNAGTGIVLTGNTGNITISSTGGGGGGSGTVTSVGLLTASASRITVSGSPVISSGNITVDLATTGVAAGSYTYPAVTVDSYGRVTSISNGASVGTVTSVGVTPGFGIQVTGSPVTTSGNITILNTGVTRLNAGTNISLSGSNGNVTISATGPGTGTVTSVGVSSSTLNISGSPITVAGTISVNIPTTGTTVVGNLTSLGNILANGSGLIGYSTGSGGTIIQTSSRTQSVIIDKTNGSITLVSAAGSTSWQTFTVTNNKVAATDTIIVNQKSGTDEYMIHVTTVAAGSFNITYATTGGTTTEQPVFNFSVIKAVTS